MAAGRRIEPLRLRLGPAEGSLLIELFLLSANCDLPAQ